MNEESYARIQACVNETRENALGYRCDVPPERWRLPEVQAAATMVYAVGGKERSWYDEGLSDAADDALYNLRVVLGQFATSEQEPPARTDGTVGDKPDGDAPKIKHTTSRQNLMPDYWQFLEMQMGHTESIHFSAEPDPGGEALANYLSWHLRQDFFSKDLLEKVCGGRYVRAEEAWAFLTSDLPKVLSMSDYKALGKVPLETTGRLLDKCENQVDTQGTQTLLMINALPPIQTEQWKRRINVHTVEVDLPNEEKCQISLERPVDGYIWIAKGEMLPERYTISPSIKYGNGAGRPLPVPHFPDEDRFVEGYSGSVMAEIIGLAIRQCRMFSVTIWEMLEALFTGNLPSIPPVRGFSKLMEVTCFQESKSVGFTAQGPVTLTVQPWVAPETLADTWREHRRKTPCYTPSEKQAAVLHHVLLHTSPDEKFRWKYLSQEWQKEHGVKMTGENLSKLFLRARNTILPGYRGFSNSFTWLPTRDKTWYDTVHFGMGE